MESYGKLPLSFEENFGQTNQRVRFLSRGPGYTLFLTSSGAVLTLQKSEAENVTGLHAKTKHPDTSKSAVLKMELINANPKPKVTGCDVLPRKGQLLHWQR